MNFKLFSNKLKHKIRVKLLNLKISKISKFFFLLLLHFYIFWEMQSTTNSK